MVFTSYYLRIYIYPKGYIYTFDVSDTSGTLRLIVYIYVHIFKLEKIKRGKDYIRFIIIVVVV